MGRGGPGAGAELGPPYFSCAQELKRTAQAMEELQLRQDERVRELGEQVQALKAAEEGLQQRNRTLSTENADLRRLLREAGYAEQVQAEQLQQWMLQTSKVTTDKQKACSELEHLRTAVDQLHAALSKADAEAAQTHQQQRAKIEALTAQLAECNARTVALEQVVVRWRMGEVA